MTNATNPDDVPAEQPAKPTVPPAEAPVPGGDVDIPAPATPGPSD